MEKEKLTNITSTGKIRNINKNNQTVEIDEIDLELKV